MVGPVAGTVQFNNTVYYQAYNAAKVEPVQKVDETNGSKAKADYITNVNEQNNPSVDYYNNLGKNVDMYL